MHAAYCYIGIVWSVLIASVNHLEKTAEPIEMPFGSVDSSGAKNRQLTKYASRRFRPMHAAYCYIGSVVCLYVCVSPETTAGAGWIAVRYSQLGQL